MYLFEYIVRYLQMNCFFLLKISENNCSRLRILFVCYFLLHFHGFQTWAGHFQNTCLFCSISTNILSKEDRIAAEEREL